jgi:hypothetical protein
LMMYMGMYDSVMMCIQMICIILPQLRCG